MKERRQSLLRARKSHNDSKVVYVELFYDLVFVFAITQLAHSLLHHFTLGGLAETAFLILAVWWPWMNTTWVTNWLDPQKTPVRLMLFVLMLAGLILSISIPGAFTDFALPFACAYVFTQISRSLFMCWALYQQHGPNYRSFIRITIWFCISGIFWIAGAFASHEARYILWGIALAIEYVAPMIGYRLPFLGRSLTTEWDISGEHMAERCGLFMIIALGESLLVTGATFGELPWTSINISAFLTAFINTVALWWIYFNISAEWASERIAQSDDPGRIGRLAYTFLHIPIVAGVILVAVSDEFILAHPTGHTEPLAAFAILGGPLIFLIGNLVFIKSIFGKFIRSHITGALLLALIFPAYGLLPPLLLAAAAAVVLIVVGAWEHATAKRKHGMA